MNGTTSTIAAQEEQLSAGRKTFSAKAFAPGARPRVWLRHRSSGAVHDLRMLRSKSCTVASAIPICMRCGTSGIR